MTGRPNSVVLFEAFCEPINLWSRHAKETTFDRIPGMRILVSDDEPAIAHYLERLLLDEGHEVWASILDSHESAEGIVSLASLVHFDAAILDIVMPGMDGIELAQWVRLLSPRTKIIVCDRCTDFGPWMVRHGQADAFLLEPFESETVRKALAVLTR
jgi:CheY-like chemotaxis protein